METKLGEGFMVILLFLGYLTLWKIKKFRLLRQSGNDPEVIYTDKRPTQKYFAQLSRVMSISFAVLIVLHSIGVQDIFGFYKFRIMDNAAIDFSGFLLGLGGLILCWRAQRDMGESWRVGIDRIKRTELVTNGVFRTIRNPTYSGLFVVCIGAVIIFPTMSLIAWTLLFFISIEFQVRSEEEFLNDSYKEKYQAYYQATKRYIPYIY